MTATISWLSLAIGSGVRLSAERFSSRFCNWLSGRMIQLMAQNDASSVTIIMISEGANSDAMASAISLSTRSVRTLADRVSSTRKPICSWLSCHSQKALMSCVTSRISASISSRRRRMLIMRRVPGGSRCRARCGCDPCPVCGAGCECALPACWSPSRPARCRDPAAGVHG